MSDRQVRSQVSEVPQMPEILERVLLYALDEGKQRMNAGEEIVPFTTMVVRDNVFLETHPGDSAQECFNLAQHRAPAARTLMRCAMTATLKPTMALRMPSSLKAACPGHLRVMRSVSFTRSKRACSRCSTRTRLT